MRGFKRTAAGLIPEAWVCSTVRGSASRARNAMVGGPFGSDLVSKDYVDDGVPVIRGQNMGAKTVSGSFVFVNQEKARSLEANMARPGDVVFTQRGTLGQVSLVPNGPFERYLVSQSQMKVSLNREAVDPEFFYYLFSGPAQQEAIRLNTIQTGVPHINLGILAAIPVPLPELTEQRAIARGLSDADALIESLEQLLAKKRHLKQGAMQELLTGKKRLPGFAASWPERTMASLFEFSGGLSASRAQLSSEGHCYLHYGDIHGASKTFIDVRADNQSIPRLNVPLAKVASKSLLADGDVVFVDASEDDEGSSKHVVIVNKDRIPFISGLHTIVAKGRTDELSHSYRRYCFQTRSVKQQFRFFSVGTKVSGISKTNIAKVTLPVPPADEQEAVAAILADMDSELDALEAKLTKARQIKQGMMQELLTGRIRLV